MAAPELDEAAIFHAARHIEEREARTRYVRNACGEDAALGARVDRLLRVYDEEPDFLAAPAAAPLARAAPPAGDNPGAQIGPYRLVEVIGEGGFGVVYLAEQRQPLRRTAALKILKPGMDSRAVLARFEQERQALALMDHPNIAKVLDAGTTEAHGPPSVGMGRPYFVMELVRGVPITEYCDEHRLTPRGRLELFIPVCRAVQHAHQKGVIHRDLKPSNVLVGVYDGKPVPKVIDFGVAKALGGSLTERTLETGLDTLVGTLEYMSPEQAEFNAGDIDTRADIYSLGVLLYELLTGTTPLTRDRLSRAQMTEALRLIREEDPPKPSARLGASKVTPASESASARGTPEPALLVREVRGELDWIVMKALDKDRDRRYATANGLARDVERYLNEEPVEACPPSATYRLRKFARKNRRLLLAAAAFVALLAAATVVSGSLAVWATVAERTASRERDRADAEAKQARRNLYAAHMNLAQAAWEEDRVGRLLALLDRQRPVPGGEDLRGFEWYYWNRLADTALFTLQGHRGRVMSVAFSPDCRRLASASHDGTVRVWDLAEGRPVHTLPAHGELAIAVAFSPDGRSLASGGGDNAARLWDLSSGQQIHTLKGHTKWVTSLAFSPDGARLVSGGHDGTVRVWDVADGRPIHSLRGHSDLVHHVAFGPDGRHFASSSKDRSVLLWDAASGKSLRRLTGHTGEVTGIAFSPDGTRLVSGSLDRTVRVWDVNSGECLRTLTGHRERVFGVAFSPDGTRVASASFDQTVKLWDATTGQELASLKGHTSWVSCVAFSPDGHSLASAGDDRTVKVWDARLGQEAMVRLPERMSAVAVAFSPDGGRLASATHNSRISVWDAASGEIVRRLKGHRAHVFSVAFSPDGGRLASAAADKTVRVWDAESGREIVRVDLPAGPAYAVAFSPDGTELATANEDKTVRVWDAATGREKLTLPGHTGPVKSVAFSPDGRRLASSGQDQTIKIWDLETGQELRTCTGHGASVTGVAHVAFSPDGTRLASAGGDKTVRVWDVGGGELLKLTGHTDWVSGVAFSPDGRRLASSSADKTVKVWDLASGQETLTLKGHAALALGVAFSPDGWQLASAGFDRVVALWDARPWTPQLRAQRRAVALFRRLRADDEPNAAAIRQIEADPTLEPDVRREAVALARRLHEDPDRFNQASWNVVADATATPAAYAQALRRAQTACRLEPDDADYANTLGVALYRAGRFAEALVTLTRCDKVHAAEAHGRHPADLAFIAMAHFQLGQRDQARSALADVRRLMKRPRWSAEAYLQAFFREATELIEGKR